MRKTGVDKSARQRIVGELKVVDSLESLASVELDPAGHAMLAYSFKLTRQPEQMNVDDVECLRAVGFDDRAIHDICAIVSYFAFVNRIADGLGVELENDVSQQ